MNLRSRGAERKKKRTKSSVWFKYAEEKGVNPHKSAWSDYAQKSTSEEKSKVKQSSIRFCTQCGAQVTPKSKFCERCGHRVK